MPIFDPQLSKIKMVILTTRTQPNKVWYSPLKENHKPREKIIEGMVGRFLEIPTLYLITNKLYFYEKGNLIAELKL
jgi:hypothetical protein